MPSRRKVFPVLSVIASALVMTGCGGCTLAPLLNTFLNQGNATLEGAKLKAPASAPSGDTITLDATGSEIAAPIVDCPDIVRFFISDPDSDPAKAKPVAVIKDPKNDFQVNSTHCRLTDAKVQVKVPARPAKGKLFVAVVVETLPNPPSGPDALPPQRSVKAVEITVTAGGGEEPQNKPPVANLFAVTDPSVQGHSINIDARESFDPDGTITQWDFDYNGDGVYEEQSNDAFGHLDAAPAPGTYKIGVRVHDNGGATATATIDQLVVAQTTFTDGTFSSPDDLAVNTPYDLGVANDVPGADQISVDADSDGMFDDGMPSATANPVDAQPQFHGMQFTTGGWKRVAVLWQDNAPPHEFTITTHLIRVTPFANPPARTVPAPARIAARGTKLATTLRLGALEALTVGRLSLVRVGLGVQGLILRGKLRGTVRAVRTSKRGRKPKVPASVRVLRNAVFAASLTGTVPSLPTGLGTPTGKGVLLARAPKDRRTMVCLRVRQLSATSATFAIMGATGKATGLRATGGFPPLLLDAKSRKAKSAKLMISVRQGSPRALPKECRALVPRLTG